MQSTSGFVEIFMRNWGEGNAEELERLLKEGPRYFYNLSSTEIGSLLEDLLDEEALPKFVYSSLNQIRIPRSIESAVREGFSLLKYLLKTFTALYHPHLETTYEICTFAIKIKLGHYTKRSACQTLLALIRTFPDYTAGLNDFVTSYLKNQYLYKPTEFIMILQVLCTIARHHPDLEAVPLRGRKLQLKALEAFREACKDKKDGLSYFEMSIDSLTNILHYFPFEGAHVVQDFYDHLKRMCHSLATIGKGGPNESILLFLTAHLQTLESFIRQDHDFWHFFLERHLLIDALISPAREALKVYYEVLSDSLNRDDSPGAQAILKNLQETFIKSLTTENISPQRLRISILGYSQLAKPLKRLLNDEAVEEMFSFISRRTLPLLFSEDDQTQFEDIADYQEALARVLPQLAIVRDEQIRIFIKMCTLMIKRFPELKPEDQKHAGASLKRTIEQLSYLKIHIFEEFLASVIYEGVVWTCSHSLLIDADLEQQLKKLQKRPITYKDYIPLWQSLLTFENYSMNNQEKVSSELLNTFINLTSKLNLRIKTREDNVFSDIAVSQMSENEDDFRIFVNMVDLYEELLSEIIVSSEDLKKLLESLISASFKHPLVSGFYRLVKKTLSVSESFTPPETLLILHYLKRTQKLAFEFSHELQISCIQLILHSPKEFTRDLLPQVGPVFTLAFRIGLNNYELAHSALGDLERFVTCGEPELVKSLLLEVLPSLEVYLRSKESLEVHEDEESSGKKIARVESALELLQNEIFLFFGRISNSIMLEFLHKQSQKTGGTWDKKNLLEYSIPFPDGDLPVHLDTILPRIIELSLCCSDGRTRIAACEALHSIVIIILGKTVHNIAREPDRYASFYKILCPVLLQLGCDSDEVIRQIFNPFMLQMTHWLSSRLMLHSPVIGFLMECIFDGLCDDSNSSIKDFSGICLAEFSRWSIKQATDSELRQMPVNILNVVEHIKNFALHPLKNRRVAAAIAFNHVYKILRENEEIVDTFWMEFLHCFVEAMENCEDPRIADALNHVMRVLLENPEIFDENSRRRRVPSSFSDGSLKSCVEFLLKHCISQDESARRKCMELYERLREGIEEDNFMYVMIQDAMLTKLQGLDVTSREGLKNFTVALDFYAWFLQRGFINPRIHLVNFHPSNVSIFPYIQSFMPWIGEHDLEEPAVVIKLIDFMVVILEVGLLNQEEIHTVVFDENFCTFISKCVRQPENLGFTIEHPEITKLLPTKIEHLVKSLVERLSKTRLLFLFQTLDSQFDDLATAMSILDLNSTRIRSLQDQFKSLIFMKRCKLLETLQMNETILANKLQVITFIFEKMRKYEARRHWCRELAPDVKAYFRNLLELSLDNEGFAWFVNSNAHQIDELLECDGKSQMPHGEFFFITFREDFIRYLLSDIQTSVAMMSTLLPQSPDFILFVMSEMASWLQRNRKDCRRAAEEFSDAAISNFGKLRKLLNNFERRKKLLINIYRIAVRLKQDLINIKTENKEMYYWIIEEFQKSSTILEKTQVLNDFLICLLNQKDENFELSVIFKSFDVLQVSKRADGSLNPSLETTEAIEYFQTLITALPITKSFVILEAVAHCAMRLGKYVSNQATSDHLMAYFSSISHVKALDSLQKVHEMLLDPSCPGKKTDALRYFLLPLFKYCKEDVVNDFFETNVKQLVTNIMRELPGNPEDRQLLLVMKIEAFSLLGVMFSTLDLNRINTTIARRVFEATGSSTEVLHQLFKKTLDVRKMRAPEEELMRLLHCAAYNCGITMVTLSKEEIYLIALFGETPRKDQLVWEKIIDCFKIYLLTQTFKELPKQRKILVNIRKTLKTREASSSHSYMRSYNLASSTLTEDIGAYDMHGVIPLTEPPTSKFFESVTLEADDLNDHECMASIVGVIRFISEVHPCEPNKPPAWFGPFTEAMLKDQRNVKLFLLKVVLNTQEVFKPFAGLLLEKIVRIISSILSTSSFSYIIADALLMLVDWSEVAIPGEDLKEDVNQMFDLLVNKVDATPSSDSILRYNYSIIDMLLKAWHQVLEPPRSLHEKMRRMPDTAVRLILSMLQNNLGPKLVNDHQVLEFLLKSLEDWKKKEPLILQTSGAIGLFLKFSASVDADGQQRERVTEKIRVIFIRMQEPNRLMKCVHAMCTAFPELLYEFYQFVTHNHLKVSFPTKLKSMEMFLLRIPYLSEQQIYEQLTYIKFQDLLENKVLSCERICLQIILSLVERVNCMTLLPLAKLAANYSSHEILEYRTLVYDIFKRISQQYLNDISEEESKKTLVDLSQRILLSGLLDTSETLQQKCMSFWTEEIKFRDSCPERLLDILDTYSASVAEDFLPIFGILFLHSSTKSPNYDSKLFTPLDKDCNYRDYKIVTSWRMKNLSYRVPLFISSYTSQCSQRFTLSSLSSDDFVSGNDDLMVRATNPLEFEPTISENFLAEEPSTSVATDDVFVLPATPSRFSRRFIVRKPSSSRASQSFQERQDIRRQQTMRQRSSIKLSRGYRIGELPDIEITHETVLNPLKELIKKDPLICKNLMISIIGSVMEKLQNHREIEKRRSYEAFTRKVSEKFEVILKSHRGGGLMISAALEIILNNPEVSFTPILASTAAKSTGLEVLGALLIEKRLMTGSENEEISSKRARSLEDDRDPVNDWVQLGELYESISDLDIALSVFRNHVPGEELNSACSARARNSWEESKSHYERAHDQETGAVRRHSRRGLFECLARLSEWEQISCNIINILGENRSLVQLLEISDSPRSGWMIPWYFKSRSYETFMDYSSSKPFLEDLQKIVKMGGAERHLMEDRFTEEIAVIHSTGMNEHARALVLRALRKIKDRWSQLSPLSVQLRLQEVIKLRRLCDTRFFRDAVADLSRGSLNATSGLIEYWERSTPVPQDDSLAWDFHLAQRTHITNVLINKINLSQVEHEDIATRLSRLEVLQKMAFIKSCYCQRNHVLMTKYMVEVKELIPNMSSDVQMQFEFNKIQIKFLRGQLESQDAKAKNLSTCKEKSEELLITKSLSIDTTIENLQLMADWSMEMLDLRDADEEMFDRIVSKLNTKSSYLPAGLQLEDYPLDRFKRTIALALEKPTPKRLQDCHLRTLKYCHNRIVDGTETNEIVEHFVKSTLEAIHYGSEEAMNYFPCVLKEDYLANEDMMDSFRELTKEIPSWKFLKWQPQLFIHLSSALRSAVAPIIERLVEDYPNDLYYSLQSILDSRPELREDPIIQELMMKFQDRDDLRDFVEALGYLVRPELLLIYHLDDLMRNLHLGISTAVDRFLKKVYHPRNPSMRGDLYRYIAPFEREVMKIEQMPREEIKDFLEVLKARVNASLEKKKDSNRLRDYSPYLSEISGSALEIPGLYTGESCPDPRYRTKIMKIEGKVQVMRSTRKPIKITFIGDDTKTYSFLVKFGEDLRLDQRLQQTFNVMNEALKADLSCSQRNLSIRTVKVIPISLSLGLVEWMGNTRTLQEFIEFTWDDKQKRNLLMVDRNYESWISACSTGEGRRSDKYREAVIKRSAEETTQKMSSLMAMLDSDALRRTCEVVTPTAESFVAFRRNFLISYSVMCVAQWILGIGDRHLENTMVQVESGECTGIDFASAFGGGIDQAIPELMPFRFTKQIRNLMEPFDEGDLVSVTMGHALRALRSHRGLITGVLGVIVHEKLNWMQYKRKFERASQEEGAEVNWVPRRKVEMVSRKLAGDHPAEVMVDELREQHFEGEHFARYESIVRGVDADQESVRSRLGTSGLSPEEQVKCLLEHATDLNVLGRTYVGWRPYL